MPQTVVELDRDTAERLRQFAADGQDRAAAIQSLLARAERGDDRWPASDYY